MFLVMPNHLILFSIFALLVIISGSFLYIASLNTKEGGFLWQSGFRLHAAFDSEPYTSKGNLFRRLALLCWLLQAVIVVYVVALGW